MRLTYTSGDMTRAAEEFEVRLAEARAGAGDPQPHLIGGEDVAEGEVFERRDPGRTGNVASRAHEGRALVDRAAAPAWRLTPFGERVALLRAVAEGISARHLELAATASMEAGKTRTESIAEVQEAVDLITTYADLMEANDGYTRPMASFVDGE